MITPAPVLVSRAIYYTRFNLCTLGAPGRLFCSILLYGRKELQERRRKDSMEGTGL